MSGWSEGQMRGGGQQNGPHDVVRSQAYGRQRGGPQRPGPGGPARPHYRSKRKRHPLRNTLIVLLVLLVGGYLYLDLIALQRTDALTDYEGRPEPGPGQNWLLVGSDSRQGLSEEEKDEYATGHAAGGRTDTMMLMHIPAGGGKPVLMSLPRDSYVPIPGHGWNKLNAAFSYGGPQLLARTVEQVTGIHLDHYLEVGLGGFVNVVNAVGGVQMCIEEPINDPKAGLDLEAGCQKLDGGEALGYVRTRQFARGDLTRIEHQRQFLGALFDKATSPGVLLNPFRLFPLILSGINALAVDNGDHLHHLLWFGLAMVDVGSGDAVTTTVPIAGISQEPGVGSVVRWDSEKALALFEALQNDEPVPDFVTS